ncbi:MAG: hypothetical protein ABSG53_03510 [Thermoguttaceae bacterium]
MAANEYGDEYSNAGGGNCAERTWLAPAIVALCLVGSLAAYYVYSRNPISTAAVTATEGRLTLAQDDGGSMASINRDAKQEIWFRVTLNNAPVGQTLSLDCDWIDPIGHVMHQNHYKTKEIDKTVWPTHARYQFGPASPLGRWTVKLSHEGNVLQATTFDVTGLPAAAERN